MGNLSKKIKKLGKNVEKVTKKIGKNVEKEVKKVVKSTEKVIKEAAIPVAITVASGGTGAAIAATVAGTAVSRQATKKIKDPMLKAAVGSAITGSFTGSQNVVKDVAKAVVTTKVAQKTKSSAAGVIVGSTLCGEYKNLNDLGKGALKEVARENVTKEVQKKTNNQYLSQGAGLLVGVGIDNLYNKLESKEISKEIKEKKDKTQERIRTKVKGDSDSELSEDLKGIISNNNKKLMLGRNEGNILRDLNFGDTTIQPTSSWDTKDPTLRVKTTFKNGDSSISVLNDFKNIKVSSAEKVNDKLTVGSTTSINHKDIRYGLSSKTEGGKYTESGIGYETGKSLSEREIFGYNLNRTEIETDIKGGCVSKQTYKYDIEVPLCGKIGSISQDTLICNDSITVTDKVGLNSNAGVCGASLVPVGKAVTLSGKAVIGTVKETGKILGTVTIANGGLVAVN